MSSPTYLLVILKELEKSIGKSLQRVIY